MKKNLIFVRTFVIHVLANIKISVTYKKKVLRKVRHGENALRKTFFQLCFMSILIKMYHKYINNYVDIKINGNLLYMINQNDMLIDCFDLL